MKFQYFEICPQLDKLTNGTSAALKFSQAEALWEIILNGSLAFLHRYEQEHLLLFWTIFSRILVLEMALEDIVSPWRVQRLSMFVHSLT